jgi:hypothetical protein
MQSSSTEATFDQTPFRNDPVCSAAHAVECPNIFLFFTGDHGYGDVSTYHALRANWLRVTIASSQRRIMLFTYANST